ncbi:MAG TPA: PEGA domain-containing protein [Candidatus Paceibacterota bacterium]
MKIISPIFFAVALFALPVAVFAQTQSPCSGTVSITDTSQAQPGVLLVVANSLQASFTITGPKTYSGSGGLLAEQNIPPGTYAVTWGSVAGCGTPPPETKTTDAKGSVIFAGNYSDLNPKSFGNITIQPNPLLFSVQYTFTIHGPDGVKIVTSKGSPYHWFSAPSGMYTVSFSAVEGYETPTQITKTLEPKSSVTFDGEYIPQKEVMLEVSSELQATVYINDTLLGSTPVSKKLLRDTPYKIRCSREGYTDAIIEGRAPEEGIPVETIREKCFMQAKAAQQREETIPPAAPSYQENIPSSPQILPPPPPSQPPTKSFFSKVRSTISSFFSRMFSIFSRRSSAPPSLPTLPVVHLVEPALYGLWKIETLYVTDEKGGWKEEVLQPSQKERYTEFKENQLCLEGNLDAEGAPKPCTNYVPLTVSDNTLSFPQPNSVLVNGTWAVIDEKLELNLTIITTTVSEGSKTVKFKMLFTKLNKPFSTQPTQKAVPAVPLQEVQPP